MYFNLEKSENFNKSILAFKSLEFLISITTISMLSFEIFAVEMLFIEEISVNNFIGTSPYVFGTPE